MRRIQWFAEARGDGKAFQIADWIAIAATLAFPVCLCLWIGWKYVAKPVLIAVFG